MQIVRPIQIWVTKLQHSIWWAWTMVILALIAVGFVLLEWFMVWPDSTITWFNRIDLVIAYIFLADFFAGLIFNVAYKSRRAYFKDNWLNLLSSIPITSEITSLLRALRIIRAIRLIRLIRAGMNLTFAELRLKQNLQDEQF